MCSLKVLSIQLIWYYVLFNLVIISGIIYYFIIKKKFLTSFLNFSNNNSYYSTICFITFIISFNLPWSTRIEFKISFCNMYFYCAFIFCGAVMLFHKYINKTLSGIWLNNFVLFLCEISFLDLFNWSSDLRLFFPAHDCIVLLYFCQIKRMWQN